jgi:N-acetylmuramic acid 6-phosphate etherase
MKIHIISIKKTTGEILQIINNEDAKIAEAIKLEIPTIESVIDQIHTQLQNGGRLIYVGAGSSGRIGVLDASEMLPTYGVDDQIYGLIAGGDRALRLPIEGAEDSKELCVKDLQAINFKNNDVLFAIGASGRTPYCIGGIEWAKSLGAYTIALCMTKKFEVSQLCRWRHWSCDRSRSGYRFNTNEIGNSHQNGS